MEGMEGKGWGSRHDGRGAVAVRSGVGGWCVWVSLPAWGAESESVVRFWRLGWKAWMLRRSFVWIDCNGAGPFVYASEWLWGLRQHFGGDGMSVDVLAVKFGEEIARWNVSSTEASWNGVGYDLKRMARFLRPDTSLRHRSCDWHGGEIPDWKSVVCRSWEEESE